MCWRFGEALKLQLQATQSKAVELNRSYIRNSSNWQKKANYFELFIAAGYIYFFLNKSIFCIK